MGHLQALLPAALSCSRQMVEETASFVPLDSHNCCPMQAQPALTLTSVSPEGVGLNTEL